MPLQQRIYTVILTLCLLFAALMPAALAQESGGVVTGTAPRQGADLPFPGVPSELSHAGFDLDMALDLIDTDALADVVVDDAGALLAADSGLTGGFVSQGLARAEGVLPATVFDPDETSWSSVRNLSSAAFSAHFDAMKDDYMMIDIEVDEINGQQRVGAVWQWNTDDRGWAEWRNLSSTEFGQKWEEYRDAGYRLIDQEIYVLDGTRYYAGIWIENKEGYGWASYRNMTSQEFSDKFQELKGEYIIIDVEGYPTAAGLRYAMVWVRNAADLEWAEWRNLSSDEFGEKFEQYKDDYRVWDIESYRADGVQYYAGIWIENSNNRGWAEYRDMSATAYRNRWYRLRDLGYRLVDYEIYPAASGYRYAGVWRQNSDRPNWPLKDAVDALVQNELDTFGVPGIGVAIAQGGEIKYMRGFGHQDVDAGVWYSARTVNRLASVAKAVTGVLALKLVEDGEIGSLDDATASYVPSMPDHHTHTLRQLLANRGGVGHYSDHGTPNGSYSSALEAAGAFWDDALPYAPGTNCIYSTHGYTIAATAFEAATGQAHEDILGNWISDPYNLPTLRVEDLSIADENRSQVYADDGSETSYDDIYWKAYGGGEEASPYDLVRFGMKMLDGSILDEAQRDELWSVPAPTPCIGLDGRNQSGYALGWDTGSDQGTPVVAKGGNQRGANTYIRIYPEKEIVIVVLANRDGGGHSTPQLGRDIGTLLLDAEETAATPYELDGLVHWLIGSVQAITNQFGRLTLTGFDATNEGGISVALDGARFWSLDMDLGLRASRAESGATLHAFTASQRMPTATLSMLRSAEGLQITPSAEQTQFEIQLLASQMQSAEALPGNSALVPWDEIWCLLALPAGQPSELCRLRVTYYENHVGQREWNVYLPAAVEMADGNGGTIFVERIRMVEIGGGVVQAAGASELTSMQVLGANLASLTLVAEQAGGAELIPAIPSTEINGTIFLPIVAK